MKSEKVSTDSKPVTRTKKSSAAAKTATPKVASHRHSKVSAPPAPVMEPATELVVPVASEPVAAVPVAAAAVLAKPVAAKPVAPKPVVAKPVVDAPDAKPVVEPTDIKIAPVASPVSASAEEIAKLAHSFWVERNYAHGSAEEDWLRAEKALTASV